MKKTVLKSPDELLREFVKDNYTIVASVTGYVYFEHIDGPSPEYPNFTPDMFEYCNTDIKFSYDLFRDNWVREIPAEAKMVVKTPDKLLKVFELEGYKPYYKDGGRIYFDNPKGPVFVPEMFEYCGKEPPYELYVWKASWIEELKEIPACKSFEGCEDDRDS